MSIREEDQLQTIEELNSRSVSVPKACTLGLIIDATSAYFDESKQKYIKKIKLVDESYNTSRYNPHQKYPYLTVFFYSPKIEDLPNPQAIGDILYLRRYSSHHPGSLSGTITKASKVTSSTQTTAPGHWFEEILNLLIPKTTRPQKEI
jgi:hypothetical protein